MDTEGDSHNFDYNWDELSVGNFRMNHSNHFFVKTHPEHEKIYKNNLEIDLGFNIPPQRPEDIEHGAVAAAEVEPLIEGNPLTETHKENIVIEPNQGVAVKIEAISPKPNVVLKTEVKTETLSPNKDEKRPLKAALKPDAIKDEKEFSVVKYAQLYDNKKKAMKDAIEQKARRQREFHSKPAPNFSAIHAAVDRKRQQQAVKVTCPITPSCLRRHAEKQEQLQKKKEEYEASLRPKPFVSNPDPDVLKKKPFVPHLEKVHIQPMPFNLQSDIRSKERKQFDENFKTEAERRQQEKEEQRQREEEKMRRDMRKATEFKAQPNPFK